MNLDNKENKRCRNCFHWGCVKNFNDNDPKCFNGNCENFLKSKKEAVVYAPRLLQV